MAFARADVLVGGPVPACIRGRPPADRRDIVAVKVNVAAASVALRGSGARRFWVWLSLWANLDSVSQLAIQWWAFHGRSVRRVWDRCPDRDRRDVSDVAFHGRVACGAGCPEAAAVPRFCDVGSDRGDRLDGVRCHGFPAGCSTIPRAWRPSGGSSRSPSSRNTGWRSTRGAGSPRATYGSHLLLWPRGRRASLCSRVVLWGVLRIYVAIDIYRFQA